MKILYNFIQWPIPKKGIFNITTDEYSLTGGGWLLKQEEYLIIGETDEHYITELKPSGHGEWVGNQVIQHKYILPLGPHKSRLVEWKTHQLSLF